MRAASARLQTLNVSRRFATAAAEINDYDRILSLLSHNTLPSTLMGALDDVGVELVGGEEDVGDGEDVGSDKEDDDGLGEGVGEDSDVGSEEDLDEEEDEEEDEEGKEAAAAQMARKRRLAGQVDLPAQTRGARTIKAPKR